MIFPSLVVYLWEAEKAFHPSSGARHWAVCYHSISCQMEETELWTQKNIFRCLCSPKQMLNLCMLTVTSYLCTDRTGMETYPKRYWASEKKHQQPLRVGLAAKKKNGASDRRKKKAGLTHAWVPETIQTSLNLGRLCMHLTILVALSQFK